MTFIFLRFLDSIAWRLAGVIRITWWFALGAPMAPDYTRAGFTRWDVVKSSWRMLHVMHLWRFERHRFKSVEEVIEELKEKS